MASSSNNKVKQKKCRYCKEKFFTNIQLQSVCSLECAIAITKTKTADAIEDELWKHRKKELIESTKTLGDYAKELQAEVNALSRLIDNGKRCISSGLMAKKANGGHFWSVGSTPGIRFNLHNIHLQSEYDNTFKHGNPLGYRKGLTERYGQEYMDYIDSLPILFPKLKASKEELEYCTKIARQLVREMKKENNIYSNEEAIKKRNELNLILGLYN